MKSTDKFLLAMVGGAALLAVVAFVAVYLRPRPTYQPEDKPEGVAFNYLFALQQKEYARAYGYLSPTLKGYPVSVDVFIVQANQQGWGFELRESAVSFAIESTHTAGETTIVTIRQTTFSDGGLFSRGSYSNNFDMRVRREQGVWKVVGSNAFWNFCWDTPERCK